MAESSGTQFWTANFFYQKECKIHGMTKHRSYRGDKKPGTDKYYIRTYCFQCHLARNHAWKEKNPAQNFLNEQRAARKHYFRMALARERLGGECSTPDCPHHCPIHLLQFDHIDPKVKTAYMGVVLGTTNTKPHLFWAEVEKCRLLCPICHLGQHNQQEKGPNGETEHEFALRGGWYDPIPEYWEIHRPEHYDALKD